MTMRVNKLITYLQPNEAYTLIEFLDQLREMLMHTYGEDIKTLLQEASKPEFASSGQEELDF